MICQGCKFYRQIRVTNLSKEGGLAMACFAKPSDPCPKKKRKDNNGKTSTSPTICKNAANA